MDVAALPSEVRQRVEALREAKVALAAAEAAYFSNREHAWTKDATIQRLRRDYSMAMLDYASARAALCEAMDAQRVPARWLAG